MNKDWTFGICFGGNFNFLEKTILSIEKQNIPNYEIIIAYEKCINYNRNNVLFIVSGAEKNNWITKKKNDLIKNSKYENICLMHDYIELGNSWYQAYLNFEDVWNVCSNKILNPFNNNSRVADWMTLDHPKYGVALLPYKDRSLTKYMFLTGLYFIVKRSFILKNNLYFDEKYVWGESEDQEWSRRVRESTHFSFNENAVVYTLKDKRFDFLKEVMGESIFRRIESFIKGNI